VLVFDIATQFYLTLPSNSSVAYFQNNTVANFRVKLAETIVLPGQWEVALTELHYPHTWSTLKRGVQQTFLYKIGSSPYQIVVLKETQYSSIEQLTKALNAGMSKETQTKVKFSYNRSSRKVSVDVKHDTTVKKYYGVFCYHESIMSIMYSRLCRQTLIDRQLDTFSSD
jgi:hypothetical protein